MSGLPKGWANVTLNDVVKDIVGGGTPSKSHATYFDGDIPFMTVKDMNVRFPDDTQDKITEEALANSSARLVPSGTIVVATRMGLGKAVRPTMDTAINQDLKAIFASDAISPEYLHWKLIDAAQYLMSLGTGTTVKGIRLEDLRGLPVPLPPLPEQKRIVTKVNGLIARTARAHADLSRIPPLIVTYKKAVLGTATAGDWMDGSDRRPSKFEDIVQSIRTGPFGSAVHKHDYVSGGVPLINPMHINAGKIEPSEEVSVTPQKAQELSAFLLKENDIIIARRGVMGRCAVVGVKQEGWLIGTGSIAITLKPGTNPHFIQRWLSSPKVVDALEANSVGSTMANLNQSVLLNLEIVVPTENEQAVIVRRIESAFNWLDRMIVDHVAASRLFPKLDAAILAKAFRGELVPQDPNDEPASALLDRIRADHVAEQRQPKQRIIRDKTMIQDPKKRVLRDSESWPKKGLLFEDVAKRNPMPHDEMRDAIFALLSGPNPVLRQIFDKDAACMRLQRLKP